ncbi:MAG: diaminopimelate epimerase [Rickettsiales bacterium]|nr:diaminopimelate epimerase [Rickettsiales bacterium]
MSAEQNLKLSFVKMSGVGNDFVIFDARKTAIHLTCEQIKKISNRKNIGCDQLIVIRNSDSADCLMEIYNPDGSMSGACGNATRCVASLLEKDEVKIKTAAGILNCKKVGNLISVNMGVPKLTPNISLHGFDFTCVDVGNPHAVTFIEEKISDEKFFDVGPKVENDKFFPNKTNVEFVKILSDDLVEVRVFERGAGETLACGSGACAVGIAAIHNGLIKSKKITTRFKGGDLQIEWNGEGSPVIMTGGFTKIFDGVIDADFFDAN